MVGKLTDPVCMFYKRNMCGLMSKLDVYHSERMGSINLPMSYTRFELLHGNVEYSRM